MRRQFLNAVEVDPIDHALSAPLPALCVVVRFISNTLVSLECFDCLELLKLIHFLAYLEFNLLFVMGC